MRLRHWKALGILCAVIAVTAGIVAFPTDTAEAARNGLLLCAQVIIPSLFPFFVLSGVVIETGLVHWIGRALEGVMRPIFRVNGAGATALALGVIGGYPVGATCAISLYEKRLCTKTEAERLLGFCNNSGPGFILGAVGIGIFLDMRVGILLYVIHILACLLTGFLFRFYRYGDRPGALRGSSQIPARPFPAAFAAAVKSGLQSSLNICAFIVFFAILIRMMSLFHIFPALASLLAPLTGLSADFLCQVLNGMLEVTTGLSSLTATGGSLLLHIIAAAFLLGWAGISIHCQVLSFIGDSDLSLKPYFLGKLIHGVFSALLAALALRMDWLQNTVLAFAPVSAVKAPSAIVSSGIISAAMGAFFLLAIFLFVIFTEISKKDWKKRVK